MRHFYWRVVKCSFPVFWEAFKRGDAVARFLTLVLTVAGLSWILQVIPLWVPAGALGLLFAYGLLRPNYEEFRKIEVAKQDLESKLAIAEKRKAVKDLLGVAIEQGEDLRVLARKEDGESKLISQQDVEDWVNRTHNFIEAAFDKGEARRFLDSSDYTPEKPLPYRENRIDPYQYHLTPRLQRLNELIMRANSLEINPDFDPPSAIQPTEETTAARLRLEVAVERTIEENENLKVELEKLTTERDTFREESEQLGADRDSLLSERCWELSKELFKFCDEARQQDPEVAMSEYKGRFKGRVERVRLHLERLGRWSPSDDLREKLEYPANPDDISSLADYLNASCAHRFW